MKKAIACILLLHISQIVSTAQVSNFPDLAYSYVKLYLFNVDESNDRPDRQIWDDKGYAPSIKGNGKKLEKNQLSLLQGVMKQDLSSLIFGLSKCFIPRHGLIYFNDKDEPIASISICFECEKMSLYPNPYAKIKFDSTFSELTALKQLESIRELILLSNLPVYKDVNSYKTLPKP